MQIAGARIGSEYFRKINRQKSLFNLVKVSKVKRFIYANIDSKMQICYKIYKKNNYGRRKFTFFRNYFLNENVKRLMKEER